MEKDLNLLREFMAQLGTLPEKDWIAFSQIWELASYSRKQTLTEPGTVEPHLYFVLEGVQRVFYFDGEDREATLVFSYPHSFAGVVDSLMLQQPSSYYFETLTASRFLKTTYSQFNEVLSSAPALQKQITMAMYAAFSGLLERMTELQCFSSAEKIQRLMERSPQVLQLVPHKYLANYIGIDPATFSKILNHTRL